MSAASWRSDSTQMPVAPLPDQAAQPAAAAKLLGAHLRQLRKDNHLKIKDVAPVIRGSISKISRLERGESPPKERDVLDLIGRYGVQDPEQVEEIRELLREALESAWFHTYSDVMPGWLKRLIGMESSATKIYTYEDHLVPGLLQTPEYARAVVASGLPMAAEEEIRRRVELRMRRQELLRTVHCPVVVALLDEGILYRPIGGARVMRGQLEHLYRASALDGINIRIVEFGPGAHITPSSPVTHLTFPAHGPAEMIYLEQLDSATYLSKEAEVAQYRLVLDSLSKAAASRTRTLRLLEQAIDRFTP